MSEVIADFWILRSSMRTYLSLTSALRKSCVWLDVYLHCGFFKRKEVSKKREDEPEDNSHYHVNF